MLLIRHQDDKKRMMWQCQLCRIDYWQNNQSLHSFVSYVVFKSPPPQNERAIKNVLLCISLHVSLCRKCSNSLASRLHNISCLLLSSKCTKNKIGNVIIHKWVLKIKSNDFPSHFWTNGQHWAASDSTIGVNVLIWLKQARPMWANRAALCSSLSLSL